MRWHGSPITGLVATNKLRSARNSWPLLAEQTSVSCGPPRNGVVHRSEDTASEYIESRRFA